MRRKQILALSIIVAAALAGCGSSGSSTSSVDKTPGTGSSTAGDIPDTATYLTYHGRGYRVKYVEGWGIQQGSSGVTISDKDSAETVSLTGGQGGTNAGFAARDLAHLAKTAPRFRLIARSTVQLAAGQAIHAQYHTLSPPDPVTGKRVAVVVDRYYIPGSAKRAILTLATPVGVDNVDAFRLIARSFRWS